jgi:hypothetical protein
VWSLGDTLDAMDAAIGHPVLAGLAKRHLEKGTTLELERLFRELGVTTTERSVRFDQNAPLAKVRSAITRGGPDRG